MGAKAGRASHPDSDPFPSCSAPFPPPPLETAPSFFLSPPLPTSVYSARYPGSLFQHDDVSDGINTDRTFVEYIPTSYDKDTPMPVMIYFHG